MHDEPSMSAGLSRSIRRMRPVERASMRTLFATAAATKSEDMLNCRDTRSMLNMGSDASSCMLLVLGGAYPLDMSYAIMGSGSASRYRTLAFMFRAALCCSSRSF